MKRNVFLQCPCRIATENKNEKSTSYQLCCQPYLEGKAIPDTVEQLMRSRYSAFVMENADYLLSSWHPDKRPESIDFEPQVKWLGLKIKQTRSGKASDNEGWVEFVARYKIAGKAERIEELSYFMKENDAWLYVTAVEKMA